MHAKETISPKPEGLSDGALGPCDIALASLIATRICHDMSGPVGAVAAGCELLADGDSSFIDETAALLSHSSSGAVARLRVLRLAFGIVGGGSFPLEEAMAAYVEALYGPEVVLGWADGDAHMTLTGVRLRVLVNALVLALDLVPGRGSLLATVSADRVEVLVNARRVTLNEAAAAALEGVKEGLTARSVQAYWLWCLTAGLGGVEVGQGDGHMTISVPLPKADE